MEAWQIYGLVASGAVLILLWPRFRRAVTSGAPVLRWSLLWVAAIGIVFLAYQLVLAPIGIGLR